ncbi:hypothetical protein [Marinobacter sp. M-5]|uniref:hypothetical protein n=1 Tax=Marinobacter sp. M-5 TaxID=3081089 RepID=UPI00293CAC8E|nr:hypothetical protein [Marinobacter sp. M-5]MDV3502525.1 hypothetical protein [Marinobacter sp. M-5]
MKARDVSKAVTTRFPMQDYLRLQQEAEQRGCTIAEVVRGAWSQHELQQQIQQQLSRLEQRQRKIVFEMLCAVVGLQPNERKEVLQQLQRRGVKW